MAFDAGQPERSWLNHERRVFLTTLLAGGPALAVALFLLWRGDFSSKVQWTLTLILVGSWLGYAVALRERVVRPLQMLSNMLAALREEDFSLRARGARVDEALGLALMEANTLGETLREQRLGAFEATALLRTVMAEIDSAIYAFDGDGRLRLVNRSGTQLLGEPPERLLGRTAGELGLADYLDGDAPRAVTLAFPGAAGRWEVRRNAFRQGGRVHQMLVLSDLSRTLREEERQAWQRLVRVLSHEINNSLAPIKSIAGSLRDLVARSPRPADAEEDFRHGLSVIAGRSESLSRFIASYARLTRLPRPRLAPVRVADWVRRAVELETRLSVGVEDGPAIVINADGDQLDQMLINLVHNAVDASLETGGAVTVRWHADDRQVEVVVEDEGPGLADTSNLFVPFFTTKPNGSGIGLALSRQIAEAHGGALTLENREDRRGCAARVRLPLDAAA